MKWNEREDICECRGVWRFVFGYPWCRTHFTIYALMDMIILQPDFLSAHHLESLYGGVDHRVMSVEIVTST